MTVSVWSDIQEGSKIGNGCKTMIKLAEEKFIRALNRDKDGRYLNCGRF